MPLVYGNVAWPPADCRRPLDLYNEWGAWYSGDPDRLIALYGSAVRPGNHPSQYRGGVLGLLARFWWGRPISPNQPASKIHIPLPGDIASYSADLLFSSPPNITFGEPAPVPKVGDGAFAAPTAAPAQQAFDLFVKRGGLWSRLTEGAELCSAYGGVYLRCTVLPGVVAAPFVEAIPPDAAVPEWRSGWLAAVTFWRCVGEDNGKVWRHLERHEPGLVHHGLYEGTDERLGSLIDLRQHAATADFVELAADATPIMNADLTVTFETGATGLAATYVPNMRPNRIIKGTPLGRSDYSGSEQVFDALDETWSSLMRDIRLAKARLVVPEHYLRSSGPGKGASFDVEQEIFSTINAIPGADAGTALTQVQFAIRVAEHMETARGLTRKATESAGYDAGSLDEPDGATKTATEVSNDASRTVATRGRKIGYWTPALDWLAVTMLEMGAQVFGTPPPADEPTVEWPDAVSVDPEKLARTVQLLDAAGAVSTRVKVAMVHPEWADREVDAEVEAIGADAPPPPDPSTFGF